MATKKQTLDQSILAPSCESCTICESNLKQVIQERDAKTQEVFDKDKQINKLKGELDAKDKQMTLLSTKFNELAKLFDEYMKGAEDMVSLHQMLLRNNLRTQELMQIKIKAFNGEGENKE